MPHGLESRRDIRFDWGNGLNGYEGERAPRQASDIERGLVTLQNMKRTSGHAMHRAGIRTDN